MSRPDRYRELAEYAREQGWTRVTRAAVKDWAEHGLVPAVTVVHWAFGERAIASPAGTGRQLLALCRLRYTDKVRSLPVLAVALWCDGWDVPTARVREGLELLASLPQRFAQLTREPEADVWDVANKAVYEAGFGAGAVGRKVRRADLAQGLGDFIAMLTGDLAPEDADDEGLGAMSSLIGLDRASTDSIGSIPPWLPSPPESELRQAAAAVGTEPLRAVLEQASDEELTWARDSAALMRTAFNSAASQFAAGGDRDFAGIGRIAQGFSNPIGAGMAVLALLASPAGAGELLAGLSTFETAKDPARNGNRFDN